MGKARTFSDAARESIYQKEFDDEVYNTAAQQNSYNLGSVHFSDQSGIANITQAGTDQRKANLKGALFTGNIGFDLQTAVLDVPTNTIDLLEDGSSNALSLVSTDRIVTLSAGTAADLVTILGSQRAGQRLTLYNILGNTITIKHTAAATDNTILTPDTNDFTFVNNMAINLVFDITTAKWRVVSGVGSGITSGYATIQDEGIALTQRNTFNFIGAAVTAVDNPGQSRTDITITGAATNEFPDDVFRVIGSVDATKKLAFEVDGFTTATTRTITIPDSTTTMAGLGVLSQTWTGTNTFVGTTNVRTGTFSIQNTVDPTKEINFSLSGATPAKTLNLVSNHSDDRILTFPDATGTLFVTPAIELLDMNLQSITNAAQISFLASTQFITADTGGLQYNVPSLDTHDFFVNSADLSP